MRRTAMAGGGAGSAAGSTPSSSSDPEAADETELGKGAGESAWMTSSPGRTPLKTVLQNFLNHVDSLEARKCEGEDTYDREFQQLKAFSDSLRNNPEFTCGEGELEVNRKKNRYKDILPFDESRVTLSEYPGVPGSDYINANYVKGASGSNAYIAAQGPLPHTVNDFWRMVVETDVQVIVMACNETEAGKHKCERYWSQPEDAKEEGGDQERQFGKFFVKTLKMREICPDFLVRTMRLRWTPDGGSKEEERMVCQFHYSAWPDHGIPTQVKPLLEMVRLIRDCQASETLPVLVHCSAGCGRTGTICAIDFIWGLLRTGKLTSDFNLFELVKDMRRQRIAMVQTVEQYILVHRAVRELFLEQLRVIDSHPYENIDDDGNPLCRNPDEVVPDYETIFVKEDAVDDNDIDRILTQRISQLPRTLMGTAMLGKSNGGSGSSSSNISNAGSRSEECLLSSSAPNPPPKQRNLLDSRALENKRVLELTKSDCEFAPVEEFTCKSDPVLFEPARPSGKDVATHRFKKGSLRLKQADNGAWKLEEIEGGGDKVDKKSDPSSNKKKSDSKKKSKDDADKTESMLLRRPSIKRIRAFFNKDKSKTAAPAATPAKCDTSGEDSPQSDSEIASALSKLPKFEPDAPDPLAGGMSGSVSVPSSLDRRGRREDPDYANVRVESGRKSSRRGDRAGSASKESSPTKASPRTSSLRASVSTERLDSPGFSSIEANNNSKPSLPVKRSKSMKAPTKPVSVIPLVDDTRNYISMADSGKERHALSPDQEEPRSLPSANVSNPTYPPPRPRDLPVGNSHSRQGSEEPGLPPSKPRRQAQPAGSSPEYANVRLNQATDFAVRRSSDGNSASADYANVHVKRDSLPDERSREKFLEQHLAKLHARISSVTHPEEDPSIPEELKKSLPLIARSSDSLDEDAKRMLKDCQEYLMASFKLAEKESERLLFRRPLKNRSAESSPMTTLQKNSHMQHLFSSHSSPSNSYNKYYNKVSSPPGTIQKSVKSPTSSIQKNYCSPANTPMSLHARGAPEGSSGRAAAPAGTPKVSPLVGDHRHSKSKDDGEDADQSPVVHDYANMKMSKDGVMGESAVLEAQRKVSAASAGGKGLVSRERRNSFREAVEKGKEEGGKDERGRYESIWFQKDGRSKSGENNGGRTSPSQRRHHHHHHHHHHKRSSHNQRAEPQKTPSRQADEANVRQQPLRPYHQQQHRDHRQQVRGRHAVSGNYENVGPQAADNGYEPVNFKDGSADAPPHQLQSVGLVAEVVNRSQRHSQPASMPSFDSGRATNGKANPPPYKEPPQPSSIYNKQRYDLGQRQQQQQQHRQQQYDHYQGQSYAHRSPHKPFQSGKADSMLPTKENSNSYVNVHVNRRGGAMETGRSSVDDSALPRMRSKRGNRRDRGRSATNRYSLGDYTMFNNDLDKTRGLTVKPEESAPYYNDRANNRTSPSSTNYLRMSSGSGGGESLAPPQMMRQSSSSSSLQRKSFDTSQAGMTSPPGVDLDAVAAMMQSRDNNFQHGGPHSSKMGRTLTGMLTGAAANFRHKFQQPNSGGSPEESMGGGSATSPSTPQHHYRQQQQHQQYRQASEGDLLAAAAGGEQSSTSIPITVPGATYVDASKPQPYAYPHRLEIRPKGPRDAPSFKKKQEYL